MKENDLILPANRIPALGDFLDALNLKSMGFAAQLFNDVYKELFVFSIDLRDQFDRYYCIEYPTLHSYLELAHDVNLGLEDAEKHHILKIRSLYGVVDPSYDDNVLVSVIECIRKMEDADEGQD